MKEEKVHRKDTESAEADSESSRRALRLGGEFEEQNQE